MLFEVEGGKSGFGEKMMKQIAVPMSNVRNCPVAAQDWEAPSPKLASRKHLHNTPLASASLWRRGVESQKIKDIFF